MLPPPASPVQIAKLKLFFGDSDRTTRQVLDLQSKIAAAGEATQYPGKGFTVPPLVQDLNKSLRKFGETILEERMLNQQAESNARFRHVIERMKHSETEQSC